MWHAFIQQLIRALTWFVVIAPWEQALRVRAGKHVKRLDKGIYVSVPFLDRIFKQTIRRRINVLAPQTLTTLDRHVVTCAGAIGYSVGDLEKLYETLEQPNDTIENEVKALIADFIGRNNLKDCGSIVIQEHVMSHLHLDQYGLTGQEFYMTSFSTSKTYRLITGEMSSWARDSQMNMAETKNSAMPPY